MLDLEKIPWTSTEAVMRAIGWEGSDDDRDKYFTRAGNLTSSEFVSRYAQWHLGSRNWGRVFYELVHSVDEAITSPKPIPHSGNGD